MPSSTSVRSDSASTSSKGSERMSAVPAVPSGRSQAARFSRYYQSPHPVASRYLAVRWDNREYSEHRKAIFQTRSKVDNAPPLTYIHLQLNLKKLEKEEFQLCDMENENQILLEKMSYIFRTPPMVDTHRVKYNVIKSSGKMRLQRDFIRITAENHAILKRILTQQPHYITKKFLLEFKFHQKLMSLNAKYPIMWTHNQMPQYVPPEVPDTRYLQTVVTPLKKRRDYRRLEPGEEAVDRLGFPFTDHTKRLKMPLTSSWRRRSTTDAASVGSRPSETSRELLGIGGSSVSTQSQTFGGSSSGLPSTPKTPATLPQTPATPPQTPATQARTPTERQLYGERPASSHLSALLPPGGDGPMSGGRGRRLSAAVPSMEGFSRSLSR